MTGTGLGTVLMEPVVAKPVPGGSHKSTFSGWL